MPQAAPAQQPVRLCPTPGGAGVDGADRAQAAGTRQLAVVAGGLSFGYAPGRAVVRDVSVELRCGRVCVLIGPNAAGKSTLMRLLMGQLMPWSGRVVLGGGLAKGDQGRCLTEMSASQRAAWLSYVPQRATASFAFTVQQVVEMGRYALGPNPVAVAHAVEQCDLGSLRDRVYTQLSTGQQQRVLLARAIAQAAGRGRFMLLDEPTSAMDLWHVHKTMRTLVSLARSGRSILVVLHDPNLAARYADEVWVMDQGRIVAAGPWERVLKPAVLEPVYRVPMRLIERVRRGRPVFSFEPRDRGIGYNTVIDVIENTSLV